MPKTEREREERKKKTITQMMCCNSWSQNFLTKMVPAFQLQLCVDFLCLCVPVFYTISKPFEHITVSAYDMFVLYCKVNSETYS